MRRAEQRLLTRALFDVHIGRERIRHICRDRDNVCRPRLERAGRSARHQPANDRAGKLCWRSLVRGSRFGVEAALHGFRSKPSCSRFGFESALQAFEDSNLELEAAEKGRPGLGPGPVMRGACCSHDGAERLQTPSTNISDWIAKALPLLGSRGKAPGLLSLLYERPTSTLFRSLLKPSLLVG